MKIVRTSVLKRLVGFMLLLVCVTNLSAQGGLTKRPNVRIGPNVNGYLEFLPNDYPSTTKRFPLIIYLSGIGSTGSGSEADLENHWSGGNYPHEQQRPKNPAIAPTWLPNQTFTVNGENFKFVIITPQFEISMGTRIPTADEVNNVVEYAIRNYRIDTTRVYLMGQSQGGGLVWDYIGHKSAYANRITAAVEFAGVSYPDQVKANRMKHGKVAVWGIHNEFDPQVPSSFTKDYVNMINNTPPPPAVPAKATILPGNSHLVWYEPLRITHRIDGMSVYEFLLKHQKPATRAFAGEDQEIDPPRSAVLLTAGGTGPNGTIASYRWQKKSGPAGGALNNANAATPTASNLTSGTYIYTLTLTDNNGGTASDDVAITVGPPYRRYEAESFIAKHPGVLQERTTDTGGVRLNGITINEWADYRVNVPTAGNYTFRFRLGTFYGGLQFQVRNAGGTVLGTVDIRGTGGFDDMRNQFVQIPLVRGEQTIRIITSATTRDINHWYMNYFDIIENDISESPLPVNFVLFNAQCAGGAVNLQWKTAGETNSKDFAIERSANGRDWSPVATVAAAGEATSERSYSFRDAGGAGSFYRIVQQDLDGKKTISSVIRSNCGAVKAFSVYPNPVVDAAVLDISLEAGAKLQLSLVDNKGAVVRRQESLLPAGSSQVPLNLNGLPQGTYTLLAKWNNETRSIKLVKK